jgi:hypothetical protein
MLADGYRLTAWCQRPGCGRGAPLDMDALAARYGMQQSIVDIRTHLCARLRCTRCGSAGAKITVEAPLTFPDTVDFPA